MTNVNHQTRPTWKYYGRQFANDAAYWIIEVMRGSNTDTRYAQAVMEMAREHIQRLALLLHDAIDASGDLAQRVTDLQEKAEMPLDQARELALSERGITSERIDAVARQHFMDMHDEAAEDWGEKSLNAQWLETIGRPYARSLLVAFNAHSSGFPQSSRKDEGS